MRALFVSSAAAIAVFLSACSTGPQVDTKVNKGTLNAKTFSFIQPGPLKAKTFAEIRDELHEAVQKSITANLSQRGMTLVEEDADVLVAYLVIVNDTTVTTGIDDYFGYSVDANALVTKAHEEITVKNRDPMYYNAGTLVIDVKDAETKQLLYRHFAVRPILRDETEEERPERVQNAVDEALAGLKLRG